MAARIKPQVSSAVAYEGLPAGHVGGDDYALLRAGVDIDVRVDAALADQLELWQSLEEGGGDFGAFADQHQGFGVGEALGEDVNVVGVVCPDLYLVAGELAEA